MFLAQKRILEKLGRFQIYNFRAFSKIFRRIFHRITRSIRNLTLLFTEGQYFKFDSETANFQGQKILVVAPGSLPIPPKSWGAVETIVWETSKLYTEQGFEVWILNTKNMKKWKEAGRDSFDVILCHSDIDCPKVKYFWPSTPLIGVSHYGYAAFPEKWDRRYKEILMNMNCCEFIICLSDSIMKTFEKFVAKEKLIVSPNGTSFESKYLEIDKNDQIIVLGKIEPRKKQYEIWKNSAQSKLSFIFVGPIVDARVKREIQKNREVKKIFPGAKTRLELEKELGSFKALLLLSDGEADALVLYEAQAVGLPIIVSPQAVGSQDLGLDWIKIIDSFENLNEIAKLLSNVKSSSLEISLYAKSHYNWKQRNRALSNLLIEVSRGSKH